MARVIAAIAPSALCLDSAKFVAFCGNVLKCSNMGHVQEVVAHARERGIRVIPEFDSPGRRPSLLSSLRFCFNAGCLSVCT